MNDFCLHISFFLFVFNWNFCLLYCVPFNSNYFSCNFKDEFLFLHLCRRLWGRREWICSHECTKHNLLIVGWNNVQERPSVSFWMKKFYPLKLSKNRNELQFLADHILIQIFDQRHINTEAFQVDFLIRIR